MQKQSTTSGKGTHQLRPRRRATGAQQKTATAAIKADSQSAYSPEVEARRADYEQLAEAFVHMVVLEAERVGENQLDIDGPDENINDAHLIKALHEHLYALHLHVDWFDPRTLRKFYVEMRLWGDQLAAKVNKAYERHWGKSVVARDVAEAFQREGVNSQTRVCRHCDETYTLTGGDDRSEYCLPCWNDARAN